MNKDSIANYKRHCELTILSFIAKTISSFKLDTSEEIYSISIPMIDVTTMGQPPHSQFTLGQCHIELVSEKIKPKIPTVKIWTRCGGVELDETEKCSICGDRYGE